MTKRKGWAIALLTALGVCLAAGLLLLFGATIALAEPIGNNSMTLVHLNDKSAELNNGYLDRYGVPTSAFTYANNGDAEDGAPLSSAFDRNFNSVWRSRMQTTNDPNTVNRVTVSFARPTAIDRIVYQADSSWYDRGYFSTLTLSYVAENYAAVNCEPLSSAQTSDIVLVTLKEAATVREITLEWTKVPTNHRTVAAASEIIFLQPHSEDVESVQGMFTDYAQLTLDKSVVSSREDVERLRGKVKGYASYDTELSYLLNRAEQVLDSTVFYEPRREMGTAPDAPAVLARHGDVAGYARSTLKFAWFGTNRQATGISASPGEDLIVYVTGEEGDPLPSLVTTQHWGSWRSWKSGEYKLRLGKNVIKVQNYLQDGYTDNTGDALAAGGPVYLVNPYTPDRQSDSVKVYFEGGDLIPVFRKGGDETAYKKILADYAADVARDREENASQKNYKAVDVTEIVSDRVILTVEASMADELYNGGGYSPQAAAQKWDEYVDGILQFDGIVLTDDAQKLGEVGARYDERNQWLNVNIRLAQPYGAAYAYTEHIGIQVSWEAGAITASGSFGWGYTHEIGHMLDIGERTVSECSNNMLSKYHETVIERTASRGDFAKTTAALAPDDHIDSYWNVNRGNFILWWLIESYWPGFWAKLDNLYRYEDVFKDLTEAEKKSVGAMNATEKQVYLSSLVVGEDLSYYFERWGYNLGTSDRIFAAGGESASAAFKAVMQRAKEKGRIGEGNSPKLWYLDAAEWWARYPQKEGSELYGGDETPEIRTVTRSGDGYNLIMDVAGAENAAHLGFEILEGSSGTWKVIGFTYDKMFLDATDYGTRTPKYRVVAYDRALQSSAASGEKSPSTGAEGICEIGGRKYGSLYEAVAAARDGDTIRLLRNTSETGIVIDRPLTVEAAERLTVTKGGPRPIFTVTVRRDGEGNVLSAGSLTLRGAGGEGKLVFDGGNIAASDPLILVQGGTLWAENCVFRNEPVKYGGSSLGGGMRIDGGQATVSDCAFEGNAAQFGGGVYITNTRGDLTQRTADVNFVRCTFTDNAAAEGGAVYNRGTASFTDCTFDANRAESVGGGVANVLGGVIYFHGCTWRQNEAERGGGLYADGMAMLFGGTMSANSARKNGAAVYYERSTSSARPFSAEEEGEPLRITGNVCGGGAAVLLRGETSRFSAEVSDNRTEYALWLGGPSVRLAGGRIGGTLFKEKGTAVTVTGSLPAAAEGAILVGTDSEETSVLLFKTDFDLAEGDEGGFCTERGDVLLGGKRELRLEMEAYTVTLTIGEETETHKYLPGHTFVLDARSGGYGQENYIGGWRDGEGVVHAVGEEITVNSDLFFTADLARKLLAEFLLNEPDADAEDIRYYVMPDEPFSLPKVDPEKYAFGGWESQGELFRAYDTVSLTADRTYTAKLTKKLLVSYAVEKDGEDVVYAQRYYPYGSKIGSAACEREDLMPADGYINGFYIRNADGSRSENYVDFDSFTLQTDALLLVADVVEMPVYIMYSFTVNGSSFSGETVTDRAPRNSVYTISLRAIPTGYHIVSLQLFSPSGETTYDSSELDGLLLTLTDNYYIINGDLAKNVYNVNYEINGVFYESKRMEYGEELLFSDPTDTLLKGAFPEGTKYSFTSYRLVTKDPAAGVGDLSGDTEMNVSLGSTIVVTEDITVNMIVYVEGQERDPQAGGTSEELALQKAEKKSAAREMANAFLKEVEEGTLSEEERSDFLSRAERALSEADAAIDGSATLREAENAFNSFAATLESIREEKMRKEGKTIYVIVRGLTAKTKTYDGTDRVEIDLSEAVYLNAETGVAVDAAYSANFVLHVAAVLTDKNAGVRAVRLTLTLEGGGGSYVLDVSGSQTSVMAEIQKAKLTVTVGSDGGPVYSGFVNGEDESVLTGEFSVEYYSEGGRRMAVPKGLSGENYEITFVPAPVDGGPNLALILGVAIPAAVLAAAAVLLFIFLRKRGAK